MLARDVMAIESVFSMSGRMLDALRSSLAPPDVESLICTQVGFVTSQKIRMRCKTLKKVSDIQEKDKNRSKNDKSEHENRKTVRSQKDQIKVNKKVKVKVNPGKWHWKKHRKPNPKT
ncbi:hypothetical protein Tco_0775798 [Tanacetum coccineum]